MTEQQGESGGRVGGVGQAKDRGVVVWGNGVRVLSLTEYFAKPLLLQVSEKGTLQRRATKRLWLLAMMEEWGQLSNVCAAVLKAEHLGVAGGCEDYVNFPLYPNECRKEVVY